MPIPASLRTEHESLQRGLAEAIASGGRTGAIAEEAARLLQPHLRTEENLVFPPLGSLVAIVGGNPAPDSTVLIALADRLKAELPRMLWNQKAIVEVLERLAEAAIEEGHVESAQLAERLRVRTRTGEEVLYPAAVLVGEYLRTVCMQGVIPARWPERRS